MMANGLERREAEEVLVREYEAGATAHLQSRGDLPK
jgi:hypothetical protein